MSNEGRGSCGRNTEAPAARLNARDGSVLTAAPSNRAMAWKDLRQSLGQSWFWMSMGWMDIVHRYRGSMLGPFWLTLSSGVFVAVMGPLYASLFKLNLQEYMPFLAIGIISWNYISGTINECCRAFIDGGAQMKQTGEGGGNMASFADILIDVPSRSTPLIQQVHICLYHYICEHVEAALTA